MGRKIYLCVGLCLALISGVAGALLDEPSGAIAVLRLE